MSLAQQLLDVGYAKGCGRLSHRQIKEVLASTASNVAVPQAPTSFTAVEQPDGSVIVTWPTPGPSVSTTQVWISTDGCVTFVLSTTVSAPGTTATIPSQGSGVSVCVKIRSCNSAGNCGPFTTTTSTCQLTVAGFTLDTFESYSNGVALNGLAGGSSWCGSVYTDRNAYLGLLASDDMESYSNGQEVAGLNAGTGWNGAYGGDNPSVDIPSSISPTIGNQWIIAATATGVTTPFTYQWLNNGTPLANGANFTGVTTDTLTISAYQAGYDGTFTLQITDTLSRTFNYDVSSTGVATSVWGSQVVTNGGALPSLANRNAVDVFLNGVAADKILSKLIAVNVFAPDNLIAAITPVIAKFGNQPWTNHNFVLGDLSVNGLTGDGATKYFDTGIVPNAVLKNTSGGLVVYAYNKNTAALGCEFGTNDGNDWAFSSDFNSGGTHTLSDCFNGGTGRLTAASPGNGFYCASRISASDNKIYFASSVSAFSQIAGGAGDGTGLTARLLFCFSFNNAGTPIQFCNSTVSFAAVVSGLTSAESQSLYNRVQTLRTAFGGGFR